MIPITERMHTNIRSLVSDEWNSPIGSIYRATPEMIPEYEGIGVCFISVKEDIKGGLKKGIYAALNVPVEEFRANAALREACNHYIARRVLEPIESIDINGLQNIADALLIGESQYLASFRGQDYPILAILPRLPIEDTELEALNN